MGVFDEPFPGSWALRAGLVRPWQLRTEFERIHPDVYLRKGVPLDAKGRAQAAGYWAKGGGILTGFSAAAMHGTRWLDGKPAEITVRGHVRAPRNLRVFRDTIPDDEACSIDGFRCTTTARTAFDLGRRLDFAEAVEVIDALANVTKLDVELVKHLIDRHPGVRGSRNLRKVLPYVDGGAESIQETRTRLLLRRAGLPAPETQIRVLDHYGKYVARLDMGWRHWQVAVEYDGEQHWTDPHQRTKDINRTATLESLGWTLVRANAALLTTHPTKILTRTRQALRAHGAPF
ncbi:endonuclease domain-containing protein [Nocardia brasiliensis]|uniref:endonuclease domain-containing protein n=1 Tax=Nocardia brasiliensis TaxID=37326 RepID=UPI00366E9F23